jgi:hypothetical protein
MDKLVAWIEAGRQKSWQDNLDAVRGLHAAEKKDRARIADDLIRDRMSFKLDFAFAGAHGTRGTKTAHIYKSANELGLPLGRGKATARRIPSVKYEVPISDIW